MNTPNFTSLLTALRAFVLKSRPAYKDYLGTESVEEKTVLLTGTLSATGESVTAADGFTGFANGQTYKATIGEETVEVTAQYGTGSFSECIVIGSSNAAPSDTVPGWMVCVYNGNLLGFGTGDWAGKQIEVATSKMVPTEKWDIKKLPKECLPEKMPENWAEELDNGGVLYVPIEVDFSEDEGTGTAKGVTFAEAQQAYKDGKMLVAVVPTGNGGVVNVPSILVSSDAIIFEILSGIEGLIDYMVQWTADGQVQRYVVYAADYKIIPVTVTKTDDGYTATSSYTYEEVKALVDERKNVVVDIVDGTSDYYASLVVDNGDYLLFSTYNAASKEMLILAWSEDAIQYLINPILTEDHLSNDEPLPAGTAAPGTSRLVSRADHVHPKEVEPITDAELEEMWDPPVALKFSSPEPFTLSVANTTKNWDGTLEYSTDAKTWTEWDGTTTLNSVNNKLYVRGTGNSKITDAYQGRWKLEGENISCSGNIETLLDWQAVIKGEHPAMGQSCFNSMFRGCTSLITAPTFSTTTLTVLCYAYMFNGCTSLTTVPELPATALEYGCYMFMFVGCGKIKLSTTQTDEYTQEYRIPTSGTGTTAGSALSGTFEATGGTFTGTPTINTTYYLHKDNSIVPAT